MKPLLLSLSLILTLTACSKQHKADTLVKDYLTTHLNDPGSYQDVATVKLDTIFQDFGATPKGELIQSKYDSVTTLIKSMEDEAQTVVDAPVYDSKRFHALDQQIKKLLSEANVYYKQLADGTANFKGPVSGWSLIKTYRAKNGFGALTLHTDTFYMDSALTKVMNVGSNHQ